MRQFLSRAFVVVLGVAAGCGDNRAVPMPDGSTGMPDSGVDEDGCRILSLGTRDFQFNLWNQLLGVRFPVMQNLDGERADVLHVELWDSTTPDLPPLAPGTFDLSTTTNLQTCQHCVWVDVDATDDGTVKDIYLATQGSLTIDRISDPLEPVMAAHSGRIVMRRATVGENAASTFVPGGDCVSISAMSFDTKPTPGQACESAEDCGNAMLEICDPSTNTCTPPECNFDSPCEGDNQLCLIQYRDLFEGACYTVCNPNAFASGCPDGQICAQRGVDPSFGICKYVGTGSLGETCEVEDNTTSCAGGAVCSNESETCASSCTFYSSEPGCASNTQCSLFGLCEGSTVGVSVPFGAACGANATQAQGCAPDGKAWRGICHGFEGDPLICQKACLGDQGCTTGEFCAPRYSSGVGVCLPIPVCGDGMLGEINEVCDDGNTEDGDGCSGDCTVVETDVLCANATALPLGATTQGNTSTGVDGMASSCQAGIARANLFTATPPARGRLRFHLTSQSTQTLSLRTDCTDSASEVACRSDFGVPTDQELIVQVTEATPAARSVMVSAMTVLEQGPYMLEAEFVPELCGDGIIAGREVCDDSNTTSNDGCRNDCRAIEYNVFCAQAPALSTSATNAGDLTGAPTLFGSSCAQDEDAAIHPTRLYKFVAPAAGTLRLKLADNTSFAVLSLRNGCGTPAAAPELACRPAFLGGELDIVLAAGESITAAVISYGLTSGIGTFTLDATFTAQ